MESRTPLLENSEFQSIPSNVVYRIGNDQLFIPCYVALVLKNLRDIDIKAGKITIMGTFVLRFNTNGVPEQVRNHILKGIQARINEEIHDFKADDTTFIEDI